MAEDETTAQIEFQKYRKDAQPHVVYRANLQSQSIIDFGDETTRDHFELEDDDFFKGFRMRPGTTPLQRIGDLIAGQNKISAIRFPSAACHESGNAGFNFVVFRDAFTVPDGLKVLGPGDVVLEEWPD